MDKKKGGDEAVIGWCRIVAKDTVWNKDQGWPEGDSFRCEIHLNPEIGKALVFWVRFRAFLCDLQQNHCGRSERKERGQLLGNDMKERN